MDSKPRTSSNKLRRCVGFGTYITVGSHPRLIDITPTGFGYRILSETKS